VQGSGRWSLSADGSHIYGQDGIYRLDPTSRTAEQRVALVRAYPGVVDVLELPSGGLLMASASRLRRELVLLKDDATLRWQRSFSEAIAGLPRLFLLGERAYALFRDDSGPWPVVRLFTIDMDSAELTHIFSGGTGSTGTGGVSVVALDGDRILIDIVGGGVVALDVGLATEAALRAAGAG
jgi:hypothetical protein